VKRESVGRAETSYCDVIYRQLSGDKTERLEKQMQTWKLVRQPRFKTGTLRMSIHVTSLRQTAGRIKGRRAQKINK